MYRVKKFIDHRFIAPRRKKRLLREINSLSQRKEPEFSELNNVLSAYANKNCYLFVGIRQLQTIRGVDDPVKDLVDMLGSHFENVITPAFTFSFKKSGVFHAQFSRPDSIGAFARQFQPYADFRSFDPIHSFWVKGTLDPNQFELRETFSDQGFMAQLNRGDTVVVNIGTNEMRTTNFHQLEQHFNAPYRKEVAYDGIMYFDEQRFEKISQLTTENPADLLVDREKIELDLIRAGLLKRFLFGQLYVRIWNASDFFSFVGERLKANPYYLVSK